MAVVMSKKEILGLLACVVGAGTVVCIGLYWMIANGALEYLK